MTQAGTSFYSRQTYFPYGAQRTTEGSALPTDYTFTGQKSDDSTGLLFYNARYYDTTLGRFTQPDTIVPNPLNPQSLNRFAYVLNNPLKYTDPTGHVECWDEDCNGGPSGGGGGGDSGGGGGGNPCDTDLTAEGCPGAQEAVPPANVGNNQSPNENQGTNENEYSGAESVEDKATKCLRSLGCIIDLFIPSHLGGRGEFSIGGGIPIIGPVGIGPNFTVGGMFLCNRHSNECALSLDGGVQVAIQSAGVSGSITTGPVVGFAASTLGPIVKGYSANIGAEGCVAICVEVSGSIPLSSEPFLGPIERPTSVYIDPKTGFVPTTAYFGGGVGGDFPIGIRFAGGLGGGASFSLAQIWPGQ